jgi:hypothetical protein
MNRDRRRAGQRLAVGVQDRVLGQHQLQRGDVAVLGRAQEPG